MVTGEGWETTCADVTCRSHRLPNLNLVTFISVNVNLYHNISTQCQDIPEDQV